jgi:hypothetical protein
VAVSHFYYLETNEELRAAPQGIVVVRNFEKDRETYLLCTLGRPSRPQPIEVCPKISHPFSRSGLIRGIMVFWTYLSADTASASRLLDFGFRLAFAKCYYAPQWAFSTC